jgi:hypothetical protein
MYEHKPCSAVYPCAMRKRDVTAWDIEYIGGLIEDYCHSMENVQTILGVGRRTAYDHVARWIECGYVNRKMGYLLPTRRAFLELRSPYRWHTLGRQNLKHWSHVVAIREYLRCDERFVLMGWKGERAIRHERGLTDSLEIEPLGTHIPDAEAYLLSVATGHVATVAIENEESYKGPKRTDDILSILARDYEQVFYFAPEGYVYDLIDTCIRRLPPTSFPKFSLWRLDTILHDSKERSSPQRTQV